MFEFDDCQCMSGKGNIRFPFPLIHLESTKLLFSVVESVSKTDNFQMLSLNFIFFFYDSAVSIKLEGLLFPAFFYCIKYLKSKIWLKVYTDIWIDLAFFPWRKLISQFYAAIFLKIYIYMKNILCSAFLIIRSFHVLKFLEICQNIS